MRDLFNDLFDQLEANDKRLGIAIMPRMKYQCPVTSDYPNGRVNGVVMSMARRKWEEGKSGLQQVIKHYLGGNHG